MHATEFFRSWVAFRPWVQAFFLCSTLFSGFNKNCCKAGWSDRAMANITALEKCFCSQAAWQKWQRVQAPVYLSQVINFSLIKTPTGMMGKGGFINLPYPGFLWHFTMYWLLVPPIVCSWKCSGIILFFPRWLFSPGNDTDLLGNTSKKKSKTCLWHFKLFTLLYFPFPPWHIQQNVLEPSPLFLF